MILLAEYALDFAMEAAEEALLLSLQALEIQMKSNGEESR